MDLTRSIIYRGFTLNDPDTQANLTGGGGIGTGISGCVVDSFDLSDTDVVQFIEKRSQSDGMDVGPVEFGARRIRMAGTLYALSRPALFDALWNLRAALNPVLAQREEPADFGYRPMYFQIPTTRTEEFTDPEGVMELQVKALPRAFQQITQLDSSGGSDDDALAITWQATFLCRDPGIYAIAPVEVEFAVGASFASTTTGSNATDLFSTGAVHGLSAGDRITFDSKSGGSGLALGTAYYVLSSGLTTTAFKLSLTSGGSAVDLGSDVTAATWKKSVTESGTWINRGTYLGQFNMLVEVGAGAGSIVATVGDSVFTITVPSSTVSRLISLDYDDKVLTVQETDGVEETRLNWLTFSGDTTYPLIDPGETPYSVTFHGMSSLADGSRMWFYEQMA